MERWFRSNRHFSIHPAGPSRGKHETSPVIALQIDINARAILGPTSKILIPSLAVQDTSRPTHPVLDCLSFSYPSGAADATVSPFFFRQ
jgi:hypothetical protein